RKLEMKSAGQSSRLPATATSEPSRKLRQSHGTTSCLKQKGRTCSRPSRTPNQRGTRGRRSLKQQRRKLSRLTKKQLFLEKPCFLLCRNTRPPPPTTHHPPPPSTGSLTKRSRTPSSLPHPGKRQDP